MVRTKQFASVVSQIYLKYYVPTIGKKLFSKMFLDVDGLNSITANRIPQVVINHNHHYNSESYHIQPKHSYWSNIRAYVKKRKTKCK